MKTPKLENTYRCSACGGKYKRESEKQWIKSYCSKSGRDARLIKEKQK